MAGRRFASRSEMLQSELAAIDFLLNVVALSGPALLLAGSSSTVWPRSFFTPCKMRHSVTLLAVIQFADRRGYNPPRSQPFALNVIGENPIASLFWRSRRFHLTTCSRDIRPL